MWEHHAAAVVVTAAIVLAPATARADEDELPEVRVREPQPAGFVSERRMDDATREVTDAASLIEASPGVHVRRLGADDSFSTLSIRGTSSTEVAIYLAGVPLSGGADPTLDLSALPLWPGARARVYRSFAPASIGRGSLGGVLVLDAPSLRAAERTEVWSAVGSFGSRRLRIGDVRAIGDLRVSTAVSASRSDDDFNYESFNSGKTVTRENAGHAAVSALASVGMPVHLGGKEGALTITALAQSRRQRLPGTAEVPTTFARLDANRLMSGLELSLPLASGAEITRVWARREGISISDDPRDFSAALGPTHTNDLIVAAGASTGLRVHPAAGALADVRLDGSGERFAPGSWQGPLATPPSATRGQMGLALDAGYMLHDVRIAASGRLDHTVDGSDDPTVQSRSDFVPTGHLGLETAVGPFVVATHGGAVSRPASFVERYGNRGTFIGDPTLRPESAATVDMGAHTRASLGPVRLRAELAAFATWANDLIVFIPQGANGRVKAENIGRARLLGVEAEAEARLGHGELRASYTGLATENEQDCTATSLTCERPPLPGRPANDLVMDLGYTVGPVRGRIGGDFVSGITADNKGSVVVPPRFFTSAGVRVALPGALGAGSVGRTTLALDLRNLFDVRSVTYDGATGPTTAPVGDLFQYPLPGRSFLLSLRFEERPPLSETVPVVASGTP